MTANEPPIDDTRDRCIRYDISCKTESGELVNIEMSLDLDIHKSARLEYYACKLFTRQDIKGSTKNYSDLKESYQITLLANGQFFDDDVLVHKFLYHDPAHNVSLGGKSQIITVELKKTELIIDKPVKAMDASEAWASFFQYLTDSSKREKINEIVQNTGGIAMASEVLIEITQEDREWARQLSEEKYILDKQSMEATVRREERREVARNFKANGVSIEIIANSTGLSQEEITGL
jgi:predicted transposase/invertase (TIGR01784 family)